jgi:MFS family permease
MDKFNLTDSDIAIFTILLITSKTVTSPLWGYFGDKVGYKLVLEIGALCSVCETLLAAFAYFKPFSYVVFALMGCGLSARTISQISIIPSFCSPEERPVYLGLANTIRTPFTTLSPILGGLFASKFGYPPVFISTSLIIASGLVLLYYAKEPHFLRYSQNNK